MSRSTILLASSVLAVAHACSLPPPGGEPGPTEGFAAAEHLRDAEPGRDVWRVVGVGVQDTEEQAAAQALLAARAELLGIREVRVTERQGLVWEFQAEMGAATLDASTLSQDTVLTIRGDLRGSAELTDRRRVQTLPDGRVQVEVTVEVDHDDLFPETRMQGLLARVPPGERAAALVDLSREYALDGYPGLASLARQAAESAAGDDGEALLDVADLLIELGDQPEALRVNALAQRALADVQDGGAAGRADVQRARLLAGAESFPRQRFELERVARGAWRPSVLSVSEAGAAGEGDLGQVMAVDVPGARGRLLVLRLDADGVRVEPLGDGVIDRRKSVLAVGDSRGRAGGALLLWLLPEGDPSLDHAADLPPGGVGPDAPDRERVLLARLITSLRAAASDPETAAAVVALAR